MSIYPPAQCPSSFDSYTAAAAERAHDAQSFREGEYTPLPETREVSRTMPAAAGDTSRERSR